MKRGHAVLFEYQCPPRRILLPDPSQLKAGIILKQAEDFSARCQVNEEDHQKKKAILQLVACLGLLISGREGSDLTKVKV